jgi:hypothetical protein
VELTVTAGLDRSFDVANALDGHSVLVVTVHVLVLELTDLVDEHTELVGDVRHVVVASLAPNGELLLNSQLVSHGVTSEWAQAYSNLHALPGNQLHATHDVLLHLDQL